MTPRQRRELEAAVARVGLPDGRQWKVSPEAMRSVLNAFVDRWVNGAGYAWPKVEKIAAETGLGQRTVFRALKALASGDEPLIVVYPCERDPKLARPRARQATTIGQGASLYRLGPSLRLMAALRHPDPAWESEAALRGPEIASVAAPVTDRNGAADTSGRGSPGRGSPGTPVTPRTHGSATAAQEGLRGRKEHSNSRNLSLREAVEVEDADARRAREEEDLDAFLAAIARVGTGTPAGRFPTGFRYDEMPPGDRAAVDLLNEHFPDDSVWIVGYPPGSTWSDDG